MGPQYPWGMRTRIEGKKLRLAFFLLVAAVLAFGFSWTTRSAWVTASCFAPDRAESVIRDCVADRADALEPAPSTWVALVVGGLALSGAILAAARGVRRVMTIPEAAEELGITPGEVRSLLDTGVLDVWERDSVSTYLNPEQVRRVRPSTQGTMGASQPST